MDSEKKGLQCLSWRVIFSYLNKILKSNDDKNFFKVYTNKNPLNNIY